MMNALGWKVFGLTIVVLALVLVPHAVWAQSPADAQHVAAAPGTPDPGMMPMMDMCRQMMGGSMMGMAGDPKMDPKLMAHMLEMRGEMMKAMGDVMVKHGRMMQGGGPK